MLPDIGANSGTKTDPIEFIFFDYVMKDQNHLVYYYFFDKIYSSLD